MGETTQGVSAEPTGDERALLHARPPAPVRRSDAGVIAGSRTHHPLPSVYRRVSSGALAEKIRAAAAFERETGTGFLFVPVIFGGGILLYRNLAEEPAFLWLALIVAGFALATWLSARFPRVLQPALLSATILSCGLMFAKLETWRAGTQMLGSAVTTQLSGIVREIEERANGRVRLTIDVTGTAAPQLRYQPQRIRATQRGPVDVKAGDHVTGRVHLLPHGGPVLPGGYDFAYHGYYGGVGSNGFVLGRMQVTQDQSDAGLVAWPADTVENIRHAVAARITGIAGGGDPGAIAAALVSGLTDPISEDAAEVLRRTGLAHILSISGLHMALVAGIFLAVLRALAALFPGFSSRHPVKKYAAAGALAGAFVYLHLAGGSVATQRSFIMLAVMLLALLFDRSALTMRNLAIAAMVVLIVSPHEIAGPSFQMSFAATAALIAVYGALSRRREARQGRRWTGGRLSRGLRFLGLGIGALALTALIGGSATALYAAYHFHAVAPLGLLTNVLAMPLVSFVVMPAGVAGMLAMPFGLDAPMFAVMGWGTAQVLDIARWVDGLSDPGITGLVSAPALACFTVGLCVLLLATTLLRALAVIPLVAGIALLGARTLPDVMVSEDARMVAVRAGDGLLLNRARGNAFALGIWSRAVGGLPLVPPVEDDMAARDVFSCTDGVCVLDRPGFPVVVHLRGDGKQAVADPAAMAAQWCGRAALIIIGDATVEPECDAAETMVIGARQLALYGSAAVRFPDERKPAAGQGTSVRAARPEATFAYTFIKRPWNSQRRYSRAARGLAEWER